MNEKHDAKIPIHENDWKMLRPGKDAERVQKHEIDDHPVDLKKSNNKTM